MNASIKIGDRVTVASEIVNGVGTVVFVDHYSEMLPLQIELDTADSDGHRVYRFRYDEIGAIESNAK